LLLALLCLAFDQTLTFPANKTELYKEALDALLKKWDSSRNIRRDNIYRNMPPGRREKMLARLAAENFEKGNYFIRNSVLADQIAVYVKQLPSSDLGEEPDGENILKAIEANHGLLIERVHGVYSFLHLTFQEYLTARYIVENVASGTVERLISKHLTDNRWHEVFLMTASLLDDANNFFELFLKKTASFLETDPNFLDQVRWVYLTANKNIHRLQIPLKESVLIYIARSLALASTRDKKIYLDLELSLVLAQKNDNDHILANNLDAAFILAQDHDFARNLNLVYILDQILCTYFNVNLQHYQPKCLINSDGIEKITAYLQANILLIECLNLAVVPNRENILSRIFIPLIE
jgi:predicted NACHT family NTPase